jgi:cytochrome c
MNEENETKPGIGMKMLVVLVIAAAVGPVAEATAQEATAEMVSAGDAADGEAAFGRCSQCHTVANGD